MSEKTANRLSRRWGTTNKGRLKKREGKTKGKMEEWMARISDSSRGSLSYGRVRVCVE